MLAFTALSACRENSLPYYSITDFDKRWQPYLVTTLNHGYVKSDTAYSYLEKHLPDIELKKLQRSEHPLLRAMAYSIMMYRPSIDHFNLIMDNLDDTAIIADDGGEWGIQFCTVSDFLLLHGRWKDSVAKAKTIHQVLLHHNQLKSAYTVLGQVPPVETYYEAIREMAARSFGRKDGLGQPSLYQQENAWMALARYRKKEDIELISSQIETQMGLISEKAFEIIQAYPDEVYFKILQDFQEWKFKRVFCQKDPYDIADDYIQAVAVHKTAASSDLLQAILKTQLSRRCRGSSEELKKLVYDAVWDNPCPAYAGLLKQAKVFRAARPDWYRPQLPTDPDSPVPEDPRLPDPEPVRWWY
ncbi:hypothetical protein [Paraflavitalea pollutisoli]|uniref:hypothetical protein n=1 Tax=Paraflavitalea pollutisoli TaxID=3034143 RepID=UPI0023EC9B6F|nr:hypothetical protein [Paraflavitalea sp. H1-2-19X]